MNMFKKTGGFTLVELIVVIAILAILAGVAVPAYSGYVEKAQAAADLTILDAAKTAAQASLATAGQVDEIVIDASGNVTASIGDADYALSEANENASYDDDFKAFNNGSATVSLSYYTGGATWTNNTWTGTVASN